jgi:Fe-S cluster assembly iron-binding protein IscA
MLTVTQDAKNVLADILDRGNAPQEMALRLVAESGALHLKPDQERPEDTSFDHDGKTVLIVDEKLASDLNDVVLDAQQTPDGPQLTLNREGAEGGQA